MSHHDKPYRSEEISPDVVDCFVLLVAVLEKAGLAKDLDMK